MDNPTDQIITDATDEIIQKRDERMLIWSTANSIIKAACEKAYDKGQCDMAHYVESVERTAQASEYEWRDISTAPKDREIILREGDIIDIGGWGLIREAGYFYGWKSIYGHVDQPTHWLALSRAAQAQKESGHSPGEVTAYLVRKKINR